MVTRKGKYRFWHIPQIPCKPFFVHFEYIADAVMIGDIIEQYDEFQFQHRIKPDYSNVNGVGIWNEDEQDYEEVDDDVVGEIFGAQVNQRWFMDSEGWESVDRDASD